MLRRHAAKKTFPPPGRLPGRRPHRPRRGAHADITTRLGRSLIHHGPYNDRIFLYQLDLADLPGITDRLLELAKDRGYPRIFARIPAPAHDHFVACGYTPGACLPGLFRGKVDGYYMARYTDAPEGNTAGIDDVLAVALEKARKNVADPVLEPGFVDIPIAPGDAPALASIYREVFETYPVPIHDPAYLAQEMQGSLRCFCVLDPGGRIAAVAAAEVDAHAGFAEMTGFATVPDYRGRGFAGYLLQRMEEEMRSLGVQTVFAVARARSYPANITFARAGYTHAGALAECVNICGSLEDMNIWCRSLTSDEATSPQG
ncbi:MAG: putative beta-lysine N-acetyltransferase [Methanomicrobiales archaeon]|nr:putative beta-lysine N-acetyltransferase [Methanomicrobiales archaeon]